MKSTIIKSLLVAIAAIASFGAPSLHAQEGGIVTILDVAKVFKNNQAFESKMAAIRAEADSLKANISQRQETIKTKAQGLAQYEIGSPNRSSLEESLEVEQAKLRSFARQNENLLLNREARVYFDTYRQMQNVVKRIAEANNIALVLRFESDDIDPDNRPDVIKGVNRSVVYFGSIDLTAAVTKEMNAQTAQAPTGTQLK